MAKGIHLADKKSLVFILLLARRIDFLSLNFFIYDKFLALLHNIPKSSILILSYKV